MLTRRQDVWWGRILVFATGEGLRMDGQDKGGVEEEKNEVGDKECEERETHRCRWFGTKMGENSRGDGLYIISG
jgi:hypothetical protein